MLWDVQMYGTGISKTLWDPTAVDGLGNVTMKRVDPFCFYPDPDAHSLDDANYMFEVQRISIAELDRRFPGAAGQLVGGDGTESLPDDSPSQLGDRGQGRVGSSLSVGPARIPPATTRIRAGRSPPRSRRRSVRPPITSSCTTRGSARRRTPGCPSWSWPPIRRRPASFSTRTRSGTR